MHKIFIVKTDNIDETAYNNLLTLLSDSEKERIKLKRNNVNSIIGTLLSRYALMKVFNLPSDKIVISRHKNGKPYLNNYDNVHFNVSHSDGIVVCVVADKPVGIDVQIIKPVSHSVIKRVCCETEIEEISKSKDPVSSFICLFTKKEAVLKKKGTGILDRNIKNCTLYEQTNSIKYENYWISYTL